MIKMLPTTLDLTTPKKMIALFTIVLIVVGQILSVDAIKCHRCNSAADSDCFHLKSPTNSSIILDRFLRECTGKEQFCRKIEIVITATEESRTIRECGYLHEKKDRVNYCFHADNEGYSETVCQCFADGCNSSPNGIQFLSLTTLTIGLIGSFLLLRCE